MSREEILKLAQKCGVVGERIPDGIAEMNGITIGDHYALSAYSDVVVAFYKAAQREALLEAADWFGSEGDDSASSQLHRMAEELK